MSRVKMYTTATCPYCIRAKALLAQRGVTAIDEIRVDLIPAERDAMAQATGRRTVPQIFIGNTHVGGCDDLVALDQRGALLPLLERWQLPAQEVHAVFPSPKMLPSKVKSLCDFLAPRFVGDWWAV